MDMDAQPNDLDRIFFFEIARKNAEAAYAKNPLDAENLTRWGGALLELSQFQNGPESIKFIAEAISRLEEALQVNPRKADALWCLGNAHTSNGFFTSDSDTAKGCFDKALQCFQKAAEEEPGNEIYLKSMEMAFKAPELHQQVQMQISQQATVGGSSTSTMKKTKKKKSSDLKYDILGWVILAIGIVTWVGMAKSHAPPPPR